MKSKPADRAGCVHVVRAAPARRPSPPRLTTAARCVASVFAAHGAFASGAAMAQAIVPDGRTATTVATGGAITNVATGTIAGPNAFNSFSRFGVPAGNTTNLHVPTGASNLINLVRDARTDIDGVLNAVKDGRIGGNVWFANPHGVVVGASGVVNVGALTVTTPTQKFVDDFFLTPGLPDPEMTAALMNGSAPINPSGRIEINGRINATGDVALEAGSISVAGTVLSGATFQGTAPDFTDVVNVTGLASGAALRVENGRIRIVAESDIVVSGTVASEGANNLAGGEVRVRADGDLTISVNARVSGRGHGTNSRGGTVDLRADGNVTLADQVVIDARGGQGAADGGTIEVTADKTARVSGTTTVAGAKDGAGTGARIQGETTLVEGRLYTDGGDLSVVARETLTVSPNVVISTRRIAAGANGDQNLEASTGDSGGLSLAAKKELTVGPGSQLLAHASGGFTAGDVTLSASDLHSFADPLRPLTPVLVEDAEAKITLDGAIVKGRDVSFSAKSSWVDQFDGEIGNTGIDFLDSTIDKLLGMGIKLGTGTILSKLAPFHPSVGVKILTADSEVILKGSTQIEAGGSFAAKADAVTDANIKSLGAVGNVAFTYTAPTARVKVEGTTQVRALGDVTLAATTSNSVKSKAKMASEHGGKLTAIPVDLTVAVTIANSTAETLVGAGARLESRAGKVDVLAQNTKSLSVTAWNVGAVDADVLAAGVGVSLSDTNVTAVVSGTVEAGFGSSAEDADWRAGMQRQLDAERAKAKDLQDKDRIENLEKRLDGTLAERGNVTVRAEAATDGNALWVGSFVGDAGSTPKEVLFSPVKKDAIKSSTEPVKEWFKTALASIKNQFKSGDKDGGGKDGKTEDGGDAAGDEAVKKSLDEFGLSAAAGVADHHNKATAKIDGGTVRATGDLTVEAVAAEAMQNAGFATLTSSGEQDKSTWEVTKKSKKFAATAAVLVGLYENRATAEITGGAATNAVGATTVNAEATVPFVDYLSTLLDPNTGALEKVTSLGSNFQSIWKGSNLGLEDLFFTTWTQSVSKGDNFGIGASVNFFSIDNFATANIGTARVNQDTGLRASTQDVSVTALSDLNATNFSGIMGFLSDPALAPIKRKLHDNFKNTFDNVPIDSSMFGTSGDTAGVGASYMQANYDAVTTATIDSAAVVNAADLVVDATTRTRDIQFAASGGKSAKFAFNGSVGLAIVDNKTTARVDGGATLEATGTAKVSALDESLVINVAGGVAEGAATGIGAAVAVNLANRVSQAVIGKDGFVDKVAPDATTGSFTAGKEVVLDAHSKGRIGAYTVAAAVKSEEEKPAAEDALPSGSPGGTMSAPTPSDAAGGGTQTGVSIAGDASANRLWETTRAAINGGAQVSAGVPTDAAKDPRSLVLTAKSSTNIDAIAGAVALNVSGQRGNMLAGAFTLNLADFTTEAFISSPRQTFVKGGLELSATRTGGFFSLAASGAGSASREGFNLAGSVGVNQTRNTTSATIEDSLVQVTGEVALNASDESDIIAIGGAAQFGAQSGFGAGVTANKIRNDTFAGVRNSNLYTFGSLDVTATNANNIWAVAASLGGSEKLAIMGAGTGNTIDNKTRAFLDNTGRANKIIDVRGTAKVHASDEAGINALALAGGAAPSGGGVGASVAVNLIGREEGHGAESSITNVDLVGVNRVEVTATNTSTINSLAGAVGVGSDAGVGASIAVNRINSTTSAHVSGADTVLRANDILISAVSDATIRSIAVGLAVSGKVGVAGSIGVNLISAHTNAYIDGGAEVAAEDDLGVIARSDDRITVAAGAVGVGASAAGIGASIVVNEIASETKAYVAGAGTRVSALAKDGADALTVASGELTAGVDLGKSVDLANYIALDLKGARKMKDVHGLAVNASGTQVVETVNVAIAGSSKVAVGLNGDVNVIGGKTAAYIDGATVNAGTAAAGADQSVDVTASNHAYGNGFVGNVAVSGVAGIGAASENQIISRTTEAAIDRASVDAKAAVGVKAQSTQGASSTAVGFAGSAVGVAGTGALAKFKATTEARVRSSRITADSLDVRALTENNMHVVGGAVGGGGSGFAGTFAVGLSENTTRAWITGSSAARATIDVPGAVTVEASSTTGVKDYAIGGAGGGSTGVAGAAAVNVISNTTEATVEHADVGTAADRVGSLKVRAHDALTVNSIAGALAIGGGGGIGAGAGVNVIKSRVISRIEDANVFAAGAVTVAAESIKTIESYAIMGGAGGTVGIGGAAAVTLVGSSVQAETAEELDKGGQGTLTEVDRTLAADRFSSLSNSEANIFSADDRTRLQGAAGAAVKPSATGAGFQYQTSAQVVGGARIDADTLAVTAIDQNRVKTVVGGFGVGGTAGVGGAVGVTHLKSNVSALVDSTTQLRTTGEVRVTATADRNAGEAVDMTAIAGAAGLVGLGAAVAVGDIENSVAASLGGRVKAGSVDVEAEDKTDARVSSFGATGGGIAVGAVITRVEKTSTITAQTMNASAALLASNGIGRLEAGKAEISAASGGAMTGSSKGGAVGAYTGSGMDVRVTDGATVRATVGEHNELALGTGKLTLSASATPQVSAEAFGVNVGAVGVGVSLANASASANVHAAIGAGARVGAGTIDVTANQLKQGAEDSVHAKALAAGGGALAGINATVGEASLSGTVDVSVGDGATLEATGVVTLEANRTSSQSARVDAYNGGILALGGNSAFAHSDTHTKATLGASVAVTAGSLVMKAIGDESNSADTKSGSGGIVSGASATARTDSTSTTGVAVGAGTGARGIKVGALAIKVDHTARFNGEVDSISASVVGGSGAYAFNDVNATAKATLGAGVDIQASSVQIDVANRSRKDWLDGATSGDDAEWNVRSGSGGVIDGAGGQSISTIRHTTEIAIGDGAQVHVVAPAAGEGVFRADALNDIIARDKVRLDSGGAIAIALAASHLDVQKSGASIRFGANSSVVSDSGDIAAGARAQVELDSRAAADTYGLAGAPSGEGWALYTGKNEIVLEQGASVVADRGNALLAAGESTAGDPTKIDATSKVNLWNKTVIPIPIPPSAKSTVTSDATVSLAGGASLETAGDISLYANRGSISAPAEGVGKDIYLEALAAVVSGIKELFGGEAVSYETRGGTSTVSGTSSVVVDGTARTGIHRDEWLTLSIGPVERDQNGAVTSWKLVTDKSEGVRFSTEFQKEIAADIRARIARLRRLQVDYAGDQTAVAAYEAEIKFLEHKLIELGLATKDNPGTGSAPGISPLQAAKNRQTQLQTDQTATNGQKTAAQTTLTGKNADLKLFTDRDAASATRTTAVNQRTTAQSQLDAELAKPANQQDANLIASLQSQIQQLNTQIQGLDTQISSLTTQINTRGLVRTTVEGEIATLNQQIAQLDKALGDLGTNIQNLQDQIAGGLLSDQVPSGPAADFITVDDVQVRLGSIRVKGDDLKGSGRLDAPADAKISITNNTPDFLVVKDLAIAGDQGGRVTLNGFEANSNDEINAINRSGSGAGFADVRTRGSAGAAEPKIEILSTYDPNNAAMRALLPAPAPDIQLTGDISNVRGLVKVESAAGSILSSGTIHAGTVDVRANNGDFVQSFVDNFYHVGGDPVGIFRGTSQPKGIVANGSVFISARYLNVNGLIQSGVERWSVRLPQDPFLTGTADQMGVSQNTLSQHQATYDQGKQAGQNPSPVFLVTNDRGKQLIYDAEHKRLQFNVAFAIDDAASVDGKRRNPSGLYAMVKDPSNNLGVSYEAPLDRFVVDGTEVRGGYIQLYGQVMNTSDTGAGVLRVLDGYGQIAITNPTGRDLVLGNLDAGRGVAGKIDITDVQFVGSDQRPLSIRTVITRENGAVHVTQKGRWFALNPATGLQVFDEAYSFEGADPNATGSRSSSYRPQPGLRFVWQTGIDQSLVEKYEYVGTQFFGSSDLRLIPNLEDYRVEGPYVLKSTDLAEGRLLLRFQSLAKPHHEEVKDQPISGQQVLVKTNEWTECNWWTLCVAQTYHIDITGTTPQKVISTNSLRADHPIKVEFSGWDAGTIEVKSAGSVHLTGLVSNRAGDTTITAGDAAVANPGVATAGRSIVQAADDALITARNVTLGATQSVGGASTQIERAIRIDSTGGVLDATATTGNVRVAEALGDLTVGTVSAAQGGAYLSADGSIGRGTAASAVIRGQRVLLESANGGLGADTNPLVLETGYTDDLTRRGDYGLRADARDDVHLVNRSWSGNGAGHLLVDRVTSTAGSVRLETPGRIIDNNLVERIDMRTWNELLAFWDSVRLRESTQRNDEKKAEAIAAYEAGKTRDYHLYWQTRQRQADPGAFDPGFEYRLTAAESELLRGQFLASGVAQGEVAARIAAYEAERTAEYRRLNGEVGGLNAGAFAADFRYVASDAEKQARLAGSSWTERELGISVSLGLLKNVTDTNPVIKAPNVSGKSVTLVGQTGIGATVAPDELRNIPLSIDPSALTPAQKVALAAAERSDLAFGAGTLTVLQRKPINFLAAERVVASGLSGLSVAGDVFLATEDVARISGIRATGEVRMKAAGSIEDVAGTAPDARAVEAASVILESAQGGIGTGANPVRIRLDPLAASPWLVSRSAESAFIAETAGDLRLDTVFSRKDVTLSAPGSILDGPATDALNVSARGVTLRPGGTIGEPTNALDVETTSDGRVDASTGAGNSIDLAGPSALLNLGTVDSGDALRVGALGRLGILDRVTAPGDIRLSAGTLSMSPSAQARSTIGTIAVDTVGDAIVTGIRTENATPAAVSIRSGKRILDAGDARTDITALAVGAGLTLDGKEGVGNATVAGETITPTPNPLEIEVATVAATSTDGSIALASPGPINATSIRAKGDVDIASGENAALDEVTSTEGKIAVDARNDLRVAKVSADSATLSAAGELVAPAVEVASAFSLAGDRVTASVTDTTPGAPLAASLTGPDGTAATFASLRLESPTATLFSRFLATDAEVNIPAGDFGINPGFVQRRMVVTNPVTRLVMNNRSPVLEPADVQLHSQTGWFTLYLSGNAVTTDSFVIQRGALHQAYSPGGGNLSVLEAASAENAKAGLDRQVGPEEAPQQSEDAIDYQGVPVQLEGGPSAECQTDACEPRRLAQRDPRDR